MVPVPVMLRSMAPWTFEIYMKVDSFIQYDQSLDSSNVPSSWMSHFLQTDRSSGERMLYDFVEGSIMVPPFEPHS
jgi:hypothetical protein